MTMPRRRLGPVLAALIALTATAPALADPLQADQWGLDRVRAPDAWATSTGDGVVIAVLDTGVDVEHPDLAPQLVRDDDGAVVGYDFVDDDATVQDPDGHGTLVAGIAAAADNDEGVVGVAPDARLLPVRVLGDSGTGTSAVVEQAIRWAVEHGADVINLSLVPERTAETPSLGPGAFEAVRDAWREGVVVVAAAGNDGGMTPFPEDLPLLLVGATDRDDERADFSDVSRRSALMAPGVEIVSTWCLEDGGGCEGRTHTYGLAEGTSFAAAFVSGAVAVLRAAGLDHEDAVSALQLGARDLGEEGPDDATGHGLLDVAGALEVAASGQATPDPQAGAPTGQAPSAGDGPPAPEEAGDGPSAPEDPAGASAGGDAGLSTTMLIVLGTVALVLLVAVWVGVARRGDG